MDTVHGFRNFLNTMPVLVPGCRGININSCLGPKMERTWIYQVKERDVGILLLVVLSVDATCLAQLASQALSMCLPCSFLSSPGVKCAPALGSLPFCSSC